MTEMSSHYLLSAPSRAIVVARRKNANLVTKQNSVNLSKSKKKMQINLRKIHYIA